MLVKGVPAIQIIHMGQTFFPVVTNWYRIVTTVLIPVNCRFHFHNRRFVFQNLSHQKQYQKPPQLLNWDMMVYMIIIFMMFSYLNSVEKKKSQKYYLDDAENAGIVNSFLNVVKNANVWINLLIHLRHNSNFPHDLFWKYSIVFTAESESYISIVW